MIVKKYVAKTMNEAVSKIKLELGTEAIIISSRRVRKNGILGFFSEKLFEVTAVKENDNNYNFDDSYDSVSSLKLMLDREIEDRAKEKNKGIEKKQEKNENLEKELQEMKGLLYKFIENKDVDKKEFNLFKDLDLIEELSNSLTKGENLSKEEIKYKLNDFINISTKEFKGKTVMVGPTGVGKTTTIAKVAGRLSLIEKKKVGLITIDTYRIGAVEQLRTYAEIMNVPFRVVMTLKEMDEALEFMKDCDVILIDSTGRSSKNLMKISELRTFIDRIKPDNISLVISSTTKNNDLRAIIEGYSSLGYRDLIITKLDETTSYGTILNASYLSRCPIRCFTNGQNVPDDIKDLSSDEIISLVMGEEKVC